MRKYHPILFALTLFLTPALWCESKTYIVRPEDTLESIAVLIYSRLPGSESDADANAARAYLIYQANRERLKLKIRIEGYGDSPGYAIEPSMELLIPVYNAYPSAAALSALARKELSGIKAQIKKTAESPKVRNADTGLDDEICEAVFSIDFNGKLSLNRVDYRKPPFRMTDGTALPSTEPDELDLYPWQVLEYGNANKTIFVFPDSGRPDKSSFRKFALIQKIADANPAKGTVVLLESYESSGPFRALKGSGLEFDPYGALSTQDGLNGSMAFFYLTPQAACRGAEDGTALAQFAKQKADAQKRLEDDSDRFRRETLREFYGFFTVNSELLIARLEGDIRKSFRAKKTRNRQIIAETNRLQEAFAVLYIDPGFLDGLLAGANDGRVSLVLRSLDTLLGSDTVGIFERYRQAVLALKDVYITPGQLKLVQEYRIERERETAGGVFLERDRAIAAAFAALPPDTMAFCDLGLGHIRALIALCEEKKEFNLVVFQHPDLTFEKTSAWDSPPVQDPGIHASIIAANPLTEDAYAGLILSSPFRETYRTDAAIRTRINRAFTLLAHGNLSVQDSLVRDRKCFIDARRLDGLGIILRLHYADGDSVVRRFFFVNGVSALEQAGSLEIVLKEAGVSEMDRRLLEQFFQVYRAGKNM